MALEDNQALIQRYYEEVLNQGDLSIIPELFGTPAHGAKEDYLTEVREFCTEVRRAFPDLQHTVTEWIITSDRVVTRWTARGTHQGDFLGRSATGRAFLTSGIEIFYLNNGKIIDNWYEFDFLGMLQQLGMMPELEPETGH